jgi:hypothetical protein
MAKRTRMPTTASVEDSFLWPGALRDGFVGAITKWWVCGLLALAEPSGTGFCGCKFHGSHSRSFVRSIAERLGGGASAGAIPVVLAGLQLNFGWKLCRDVCAHDRILSPNVFKIKREK